MTTMTDYPVHVNARLDTGLSRWLWLVKWLLVLPHYLVLAFLWLAFFVLSVVAFFAIVITGKYPHSIFEFNVGVLRWSWRVAYYAYGALGTDRYPPFTLHDVPDYPTHLDVEYPQHLSRGLVLVKWWLLAIPHYIVVGLLLGGAGYVLFGGTDENAAWGTGLIGLLVLVAGVVLLFTGRYPQQLFDLILGLNRWVLRVAAYAGLMTDKYPPFSLDQGGAELRGSGGPAATLDPAPTPASGVPTSAPAGTPPGTSPPDRTTTPPLTPGSRTSGWTAGRVVSLVVGAFLAFVSVGTGIAGSTLFAADQGGRDSDGFLMSPSRSLTTSSYAIASTPMEIRVDDATPIVPQTLLGDAKLTATSENGTEVFVGIGPSDQVGDYLEGFEHATLVDLTDEGAEYEVTDGSAPGESPEELDFWVAQSSGSGQQEVTWAVEDGDWTTVVMNADTSADVAVEMTAGAEIPALPWLVLSLLSTAALSLVAAILMIAFPVRAAGREGRMS